jgi:hypothetical protein
LEEHLPAWIAGGVEDVAVLALRCCSLMVELTTLVLSEKAPSSVTITTHFRGLFPPAWFKKEETAALVQATTNQAICAAFARPSLYVWLIDSVRGACAQVMRTFLENPRRVNLALTELYTKAVVLPIPGASFFFLSKECEAGLYPIVAAVCQTCTRRFASTPAIEKVYLMLARKTIPTDDSIL